MSDPPARPVPRQRILRMRLPQRQAERVFGSGNRHEVHVIRHQAPAQDVHALTVEMVADNLDVALAISGRFEHVLTAVAALHDVLRQSRLDKAGAPWHARWWVEAGTLLRKMRLSPFFRNPQWRAPGSTLGLRIARPRIDTRGDRVGALRWYYKNLSS